MFLAPLYASYPKDRRNVEMGRRIRYFVLERLDERAVTPKELLRHVVFPIIERADLWTAECAQRAPMLHDRAQPRHPARGKKSTSR